MALLETPRVFPLYPLYLQCIPNGERKANTEKDSDKRQEVYLSVSLDLRDFFHQYFVIFSTQILYMFCSIYT